MLKIIIFIILFTILFIIFYNILPTVEGFLLILKIIGVAFASIFFAGITLFLFLEETHFFLIFFLITFLVSLIISFIILPTFEWSLPILKTIGAIFLPIFLAGLTIFLYLKEIIYFVIFFIIFLLISFLTPFILSPTFEGPLATLRTIGTFFSVFFFVAIIILIIISHWLRLIFLEDLLEFFTYRPFGMRKAARDWAKIMKRLDTDMESEYKLAVIEADGMLDNILERTGYRGENLEERLKQLTPATLPNLEALGEAHKIRDNIAYDPDYRLNRDQARNVLGAYEQALRDLQVF